MTTDRPTPDHPMDRYAYVGCRCSHCAAIRVVDRPKPGTETPVERDLSQVWCRCGTGVLPENWANHLLRADKRPHYAMEHAELVRNRAARALDKALRGYVLPLGWQVAADVIQDVLDAVPELRAAAKSRPEAGEAELVGLLDGIRDEVREAVLEGDAQDCSSADCIADAVYEIVRVRLRAAPRVTSIRYGTTALAEGLHAIGYRCDGTRCDPSGDDLNRWHEATANELRAALATADKATREPATGIREAGLTVQRWLDSLHEDHNGLVWTTKDELRAVLVAPTAAALPTPEPGS